MGQCNLLLPKYQMRSKELTKHFDVTFSQK